MAQNRATTLNRTAVLLALTATLALAGCGVKGDLEPPPSRTVAVNGEEGKAPPPPAPPEKKNRPFILDWLL